jgi:hypothetical protein
MRGKSPLEVLAWVVVFLVILVVIVKLLALI